MEELFVYSLKYKHILILDEKLYKAMTVMHDGCVYCYFSVGLHPEVQILQHLYYEKKKVGLSASKNFRKSQFWETDHWEKAI